MNGKERSRFRYHRGNKQQASSDFRIVQTPQGEETSPYGAPPGYSSTGTMMPANTLDISNLSLNDQKMSFKDNSGSGYEISVQSTKRPEGCFITLKRVNIPKYLECFDSLWAFLHKNTTVEDWKDAAMELSAQFHEYHSVFDTSNMPVNRKSISFLEEHHIRPLQNHSESFPDAIYYCHLCHYHIASVKIAKNHLEGGDHLKDEERIEMRNKFINGCNELPPAFYEALNKIIGSTVLEVLETTYHEGLARLQSVKNVLHTIFKETLTDGNFDFDLSPFGPILRRCSDNDSPLKFCFDSESVSLSDALDKLKELAGDILSYQQRNGYIADACLKSSCTQIITGSLEGRKFAVYYKGNSQLRLSELLLLYTEKRPFVSNLMRLVRYWAKICSLDRSDSTRPGLPHHAFDIMVVHFLQKKALLPVISLSQEEHGLHFNPTTVNIQEVKERSQESISTEVTDLGKLFLEFLSHYCLNHEEVVQITRSTPVSKDETKGTRKLFHIVDPFRTDNVVTFSRSFQCYFFNCFMSTYVHLTVPRNKAGPIAQVSLYQKLTESPRKKKPKTNADTTRNDFGCDDLYKAAVEDLNGGPSVCKNTPSKCTDAEKMEDDNSTVPDALHLNGNLMGTPRRKRHRKANNKPDPISSNVYSVETEHEHRSPKKDSVTRLEVPDSLSGKDMYTAFFLRTLKDSYKCNVYCWRKSLARAIKEPIWTGKGLEDSGVSFTESGQSVTSLSNKKILKTERTLNSPCVEVPLTGSTENESAICLEDFLAKDHAESSYCCEPPYNSDEIPATQDKASADSCVLPNISASETCEIINEELAQPMVVMLSEVPEKMWPESDCALIIPNQSLEVCIECSNEVVSICEEVPMKVACDSNNPDSVSRLEEQTEKSDLEYVDILAQLAPSEANAVRNPVQSSSAFQETIQKVVLPLSPEFSCANIESHPYCDDKQMDGDGQTMSVTENRIEETTIAGNNVCFEELHIRHDLQGTLSDLVNNICCDWTVDDFCFDLDTKENFTGGFIPEFKCSHCEKIDHAPDSCPTIQLLPLANYNSQPPTNQTNDLCKLIERNYVDKKVSIHHLNSADDFVQRLLKKLENDKEFGKGVRLDIFGSLRNGFGIDSSDVDLCLRFKDDEQPTNVPNNIMQLLSRALKTIGCRFDDIRVITNCKVPIVKFVWWPKDHPEWKIDGDISFYNNLALANTKLLHEYSLWGNFMDDKAKIRPRVKLLGLWIKMWAKKCGIGDASSGSLSSYAYTLLMIHFLQNLGDPVLPHLQDKDTFKSRGNLRAPTGEQYDTYFYEGNEKERKRFSKNMMSVAELFLGFLDYYSEFDFTNTVIQIRRKNTLTKLEKGWNAKIISIEDPFELEHNLGRGVSVRMAVYIQNTFRRSRDVFRSHDVHHTFLKEHNLEEGAEATMDKALRPLLEETLLNACIGQEVAPPDRICTNCKKPGHRHHACPYLSKRRPAYCNPTGSEPRRRNEVGSSKANPRQFSRSTEVDEIIEGTGKISLKSYTPSKDPKEAKQAKLATDANSRWWNGAKITPGFGGETSQQKENNRAKKRF